MLGVVASAVNAIGRTNGNRAYWGPRRAGFRVIPSDDISNQSAVEQRLEALSADHRFLIELLQQAPGFIAVLRGRQQPARGR